MIALEAVWRLAQWFVDRGEGLPDTIAEALLERAARTVSPRHLEGDGDA